MTWNKVTDCLPENNCLVDVWIEHKIIDENYPDDYVSFYERIIDAWYISTTNIWYINHPKYQYPSPLETKYVTVLFWMNQPPAPKT